MKILSIFAATLIATSALASPAFAQETDEQWEGGYIGGTFGLSAQNSDRGESVLFDTNRDGNFDNNVNTVAGANAFSPGFCNGTARSRAAADGCTSDPDDIDYSVRAGYDVQSGHIVYGVLLEAGKSQATDSVTAFSITPASYTFTRKLDYSLSARARAGYAAKGALFYATGGATWGQIKNRFTTTNTVNSFADNGNTSSVGYSVGGGAEVKVTPHITMGLEYLHTKFTKDKYVVDVGPGTAGATNPFLLVSGGTDMRRSDAGFGMNSIRLTAAFRF